MIFKKVQKSPCPESVIERKRPAEPIIVSQQKVQVILEEPAQSVFSTITESSPSLEMNSKPKKMAFNRKKLVSKEPKSNRKRRQKVKPIEEVIGMSNEEEKMLTIAIKNSIREQKASPSIKLKEIEEMKTYYPTDEEFKDPVAYLETLYKQGASEFGCIKIVPPASYKPPVPIDQESPQKLPTRFQTLQDLSMGKPFDTNQEGLTCSELKNRVPGNPLFQRLLDEEKYDDLEKEFWKHVENNESDTIEVEYAADLPYSQFGIGPINEERKAYSENAWHLNSMHNNSNSLLQFCPNKSISGITVSWIYVGMLFSSFCWHYEDIMMYSVNYMHAGTGKIWYAIPDYHRTKFERLAKQKLAMLFDEDPNLLHNINVMINPAYLVENGVHVYRTLQRPGEFVITFPESYHQGVSVGYNVAEAVNITIPSWLDSANKAMSIYMATKEKVPVFPMDWLLIENARHIYLCDFSLEHLQTLHDHYERWLEKELVERSLIASNFPDKNMYNSTIVKQMEDRDNVDEDQYECYYCINLCYASFIQCLNCGKHYCISHDLHCNCMKEKIRVVLRYSNHELNQFLLNLKEKIALVGL